MSFKIKLTEPSGFCYGVKRAVNIAEKALRDEPDKIIYSLGEIIHNKDTVKNLSERGLNIIKSLNGAERGSAIIISSHGTKPNVLTEAKKKGIKIIDATCPNVITSQRLCKRLKGENYFIVIIGDKHHREIEALREFAGKNNLVIKNAKEARARQIPDKRIGIVVQTTQSKENLISVLAELVKKDYNELRIFNTICNDTSMRQKAAIKTACGVDTMLVIGGKHSANTRRLYELCKNLAFKCYHIENEKELNPATLRNSKRIGLMSGASTPDWVIKNVIKKIKNS